MPRQATVAPTPNARWALLGASFGLLLALITQAPAQWLTQAIEQASGDRVRLSNPQGTVWHGSAQWAFSEGPLQASNTNPALPTRVTWQLGPQLSGPNAAMALRASLASDCCTSQPIEVQVSPLWRGLRLQVSDHQSQWPAAWLIGLGAPWNTLQIQGQLQLKTTGLLWTRQAGAEQLQGKVELQLLQISTRLSSLRPLGSYRVQLQGGESIALTLQTLQGPLQLEGSGQLQNGRLRFNGEASATPETQGALSNLLNLLGQRQGQKSILRLG